MGRRFEPDGAYGKRSLLAGWPFCVLVVARTDRAPGDARRRDAQHSARGTRGVSPDEAEMRFRLFDRRDEMRVVRLHNVRMSSHA